MKISTYQFFKQEKLSTEFINFQLKLAIGNAKWDEACPKCVYIQLS